MNRRQFLTNVSAAAVASALPAVPVVADFAIMQPATFTSNADRIAIQEIYWCGRRWWITGTDNVIHFSEPCDLDQRSFCATGEELG